jgi:hypothetical protein
MLGEPSALSGKGLGEDNRIVAIRHNVLIARLNFS